MKTILLGTDFSEVALNASDYAADLACSISAELYILHVCQMPISYSEIPVPFKTDDIYENAQENMKELAFHLRKRTKNQVNIVTEIRWENFFSELVDLANQIRPFAVILGSKAISKGDQILFGSHSLYTLRNISWPLIVVPFGVSFKRIQKIGFACDFKNIVETIPILKIKEIVKLFNAELKVIHVDPDQDLEILHELKETQWLKEILKDLHTEFHNLYGDNLENAIQKFTEESQLDLILIVPKKNSLIDQIFFNGHTRNLVNHAHFPIMALQVSCESKAYAL